MTSLAAPVSQTTDYLFDFLYLDRDKISSYCAQLFDSGVLTTTKQTSGTQESSSGTTHAGLGRLAGYKAAELDAVSSSIERHYDAAWTLPLNVINALSERGYIVHDITEAAIGQVVLFRGNIQIIDLRMVQEIWQPLVKMETAKLPDHTKDQAREKRRIEAEMRSTVDILEKLPHTLQLKVFSGEDQCWATLNPDHMTINPSDLAFKHGPSIPGQWAILGVLDARPEVETTEEPSIARVHTDLELGMLQMMQGLRTLLGRSVQDFGITPIALFRTVTPPVTGR